MKKLLLLLLLPFYLFSQTEADKEVNIGKIKLVFPNPLTKSNILGFRTYDMTGAYSIPNPIDTTSLSNRINQRWSLLGNNLTNPATNFVGTTDNVGLSFRTNNVIRQTITNTGNVGIGTTTPNAQLQLGNTVANRKIVLYENANNDHQYYGLGINSAVLRYQIPAVGSKHIFYAGTSATASNALMTIQGNGNVGIGTTAPTSVIHINGSEAGSITNITATTTLNGTHHKVLVSNGATNITITFPNALTCLGREYVISRAAGSTGTITVVGSGTQIQALTGTLGATTSIGLHSATGGGLNIRFTAINIGGVGVWVRI